MQYLADTNWLSRLQSEIFHRREGPASKLLGKSRVFINTISMAEFLSGALDPMRVKILSRMDKLPPISYKEAQKAAELRRRQRKISKTLLLPDAFMAASAMHHRCRLLTADKDFSGIPGLDWSSYRD
jgi:predicted nucleic acid-binding protein